MNHYGQLARDHWMQWLPERFATIENPEAFFTDLGQQIHSQIDTLCQATLTTMPTSLPADEIDGWKNTARQMATEQKPGRPRTDDGDHGSHARVPPTWRSCPPFLFQRRMNPARLTANRQSKHRIG